ncbi:MAG: DUF2520 domain-containing protein [Roseivirga sp.]|uniref:Rossmann-like and DUF2520 domain-containing protein n=1 Tax=Roseivirga sp. TaxID=1964215 RepID=UPI001B000288|nr:Rossmann-like and DUF2520 domain-containing protein [Roseivirga sp.]MBO6494976.1 DUF2520 domain-containing protein [Roseivirga sp.]
MTHRIAILGTGNVAWHLARVLENAGHIIAHIYNRDGQKAKQFGLDYFNASTGSSLNLSEINADIFILAISDDSIEEVASSLSLPENAILCHTSGSKPLKVLGYAPTENIGVFYPLQTFSKGKKVDFENIPICIEAENRFILDALRALGDSISSKTQEISSQQRKAIHLAAVFACNFTNHMFTVAQSILQNQEMDFELLKPLIVETLNKSFEIGPERAQTGPAIREDLKTLDLQFDSLKSDPELAEIYRLISQHIIDYYAN